MSSPIQDSPPLYRTPAPLHLLTCTARIFLMDSDQDRILLQKHPASSSVLKVFHIFPGVNAGLIYDPMNTVFFTGFFLLLSHMAL